MTPDQREEIEESACLFESTRDPGDLLEVLRRTLQYCDAPYEVRAVVQAATERWLAGRTDPGDDSSPAVRTLGDAFGAKERPGRWRPALGALRTDRRGGVTFAWEAYHAVRRLLAEPGSTTDRDRRGNVFELAAARLPLDSAGRQASPRTVERCYYTLKARLETPPRQ